MCTACMSACAQTSPPDSKYELSPSLPACLMHVQLLTLLDCVHAHWARHAFLIGFRTHGRWVSTGHLHRAARKDEEVARWAYCCHHAPVPIFMQEERYTKEPGTFDCECARTQAAQSPFDVLLQSNAWLPVHPRPCVPHLTATCGRPHRTCQSTTFARLCRPLQPF
jgi:hypothetical protein